MKQLIRNNCFETNSSSAHSLVIISKDTFNDWKNGNKRLVTYMWSDSITDKHFKDKIDCADPYGLMGNSYEDYEDYVINSAYTDHTFWSDESCEYELSKEGLDAGDFNRWDKNPQPFEDDAGNIRIEVFGRDG